MTNSEKSISYFKSGFNCSQSVFAAFVPQFGIPEADALPRNLIKRLRAIKEFTDLGSGLNLAMRDLEILSGGNLLSTEQSGFIIELGFENYENILSQAFSE